MLAIFAVAQAFDAAPLDRLLTLHVQGGLVDYEAFRKREAELDAWLTAVAVAPPDQPPAFWVNVHNALVIDAVIDSGPQLPKRVGDLPGFFDRKYHPVAGERMTLVELQEKVRSFRDARWCFALNAGSAGWPALRDSAWSDATELESAEVAFVERSRVDDASREIRVSKLVDRWEDDIRREFGTVRKWLSARSPRLKSAFEAGYTLVYVPPDAKLNATK